MTCIHWLRLEMLKQVCSLHKTEIYLFTHKHIPIFEHIHECTASHVYTCDEVLYKYLIQSITNMSNSNSYIVTHTVKTLDSLQESLDDILSIQIEDMKKKEEKRYAW